LPFLKMNRLLQIILENIGCEQNFLQRTVFSLRTTTPLL
jgi:hypothetical protein